MKMIQKQIFLIILICSFFLLHGSQRDSNTQVHGELVQEPADEAAYTTNRKVTNLSDVCKSDDIDHWRQNQTNAFKCKQHEWRHTGKVAQMCTPKIDLDNELGEINLASILHLFIFNLFSFPIYEMQVSSRL